MSENLTLEFEGYRDGYRDVVYINADSWDDSEEGTCMIEYYPEDASQRPQGPFCEITVGGRPLREYLPFHGSGSQAFLTLVDEVGEKLQLCFSNEHDGDRPTSLTLTTQSNAVKFSTVL